MATATYEDFVLRHPESTASRETVEAFIEDAAAEIDARCEDRGTTYGKLVESRRGVLLAVECDAAYRRCGRPSVGGIPQEAVNSFSQTVGDHKWDYTYQSGGGSTSLLDSDWKRLGLAGMQVGWLGVGYSEGR